MSSKHTPGPWVAHKAEDLHGYNHFVMTPNGFLGYLPKDSEGGGAQLFIKADAHLIAAAPELLEALIRLEAELVEDKYGECYEPSPFENLALARAAIAKATGGAQ